MPVLATRRFPNEALSASTARSFVRTTLHGIPALQIGVAELLTSELVSNAVLHGRAPTEVTVEVHDQIITVSVSDGSSELPVLSEAEGRVGHGRGLPLVAAMSDDWGVTPSDVGKAVWFTLVRNGPGCPASAHAAGSDPP
jgi:anti-sigma regulatory factor (Ser/Thr protein kinase)